MPSLDLIIVSFNCRDYLQACLQSIAGSRETIDMNVVVIDNASTDGSADVAREFVFVRVIALTENTGYAAANNRAMRETTGEWILLLNPDCELREDLFSPLLRFADAHPEAGVVGARLLNPDGSLQPSGRVFPTLGRWFVETTGLYRLRAANANLDSSRDYSVSCEVDEVSGACMLLRRKALEQVGLFDERFFLLWEDVDLCKRLCAAGWKTYYCAEACVVHHFGVSRQSVSEFVRKVSEQSAEWYFRKHHGIFAFMMVRMAHLMKRLIPRRGRA